MEEAAAIAQAMEFIESKPKKFGSEISQGGTNVSGGQKQRLSMQGQSRSTLKSVCLTIVFPLWIIKRMW